MANKLSSHLMDELQAQVGTGLEILKDKNSTRFQEHAKRWTDIDRQTPGTIVLPVSEEQIKQTVRISDICPHAVTNQYCRRFNGLFDHQFLSLPKAEAIASSPQ